MPRPSDRPRALAIRARLSAVVGAVVAIAGVPAAAWPPSSLSRLSGFNRPGTEAAEPTPDAAERGPREIFPHVRIDLVAGLLEFDAVVPINAHAPDGSVVFLEVIACRRDSKEHEALAMTDALASHIHAGLLLLGLEPGSPGRWVWRGDTPEAIAPEGDEVRITIAWTDGEGVRIEHAATDLVVSRGDGRTLTGMLGAADADDPPGRFVFAGSRMVLHQGREFYDADGTGLIVGMHTFGSEVVALTRTMSPEASILEPEWIARRDLLPERGTAVVVRIRAGG